MTEPVAAPVRLTSGVSGLRTRIAPGLRAVRRRLGPVLGIVSPVGWIVLALAVGGWLAGPGLNWTELTVMATVFTVLLVVAVCFVLGRNGYRVELDLTTHRVVAGERAVGRVLVANAVDRALLPSRIELAVGRGTAQFTIPRLTPTQSHEELFAVPTRRRTVLTVGPVRSVRDDPLSLMRRQVTWAGPQELYVHPRTVALGESAVGFLRDLEGIPTSDLSSSDIAFHALRDYVPGDDVRHIHWRSTARTGKIMIRQFEETRRAHVVVALDTLPGHYADEAEFETAVSAAASIAAHTQREEKQLTALSMDGTQRTATPRALMDDYTRIEHTGSRRTLHDLGRVASDLAPSASAVFLVVGSGATPAEIHSAALQLPLGILVVAIRCEIGAATRRASLSDLQILTLGDLTDLPRALGTVVA